MPTAGSAILFKTLMEQSVILLQHTRKYITAVLKYSTIEAIVHFLVKVPNFLWDCTTCAK